MNFDEAADALRNMYRKAPRGEKTTSIYLFGIKYADHISSMSLSAIVEAAGLPRSYLTEVHNGIRLARYVELK